MYRNPTWFLREAFFSDLEVLATYLAGTAPQRQAIVRAVLDCGSCSPSTTEVAARATGPFSLASTSSVAASVLSCSPGLSTTGASR
jgi:hypothetical protein